MRLRFKVFDKIKGIRVDLEDLTDEIVNHNLGDRVQFAILEDGGLILTDEYNNWVFVDPERYCVKEIQIIGGD